MSPIWVSNYFGAAMRYLLRDEFTDTLTAGNVNGTAATPGPGTRVAIETDGQLSISSDKLNFPAVL